MWRFESSFAGFICTQDGGDEVLPFEDAANVVVVHSYVEGVLEVEDCGCFVADFFASREKRWPLEAGGVDYDRLWLEDCEAPYQVPQFSRQLQ